MISVSDGRMPPPAEAPREERFRRLFEEHFEAVRRYVLRRDPALADDILAETFFVARRRSRRRRRC